MSFLIASVQCVVTEVRRGEKRRELILAFSELIVRCLCAVLLLPVLRVLLMIMIHWATHNQSLLSSPTRPQHGWTLQMWVQFWWCWSGGLPSKTWPTPGWGPPEARLPTPASWTWPVVADSGGTLQSSSRLESSSQSDPSWLPVFTSFWPNFEIYSTGWIHLRSIVTSDVWDWSLWPCLCLWCFVWILSELVNNPSFPSAFSQCSSMQVTLTTRTTESSVTMWSRPQESSPPKNFGNTQKVSSQLPVLAEKKSLEHCIYW